MTGSLHRGVTVAAAAWLVAGCGTLHVPAGPAVQAVGPPTAAYTVAGPTPADGSGSCSGVAIDIAPGARGAASPGAAIRAFLRSATAGFPLPPDGWTSSDGTHYTSGTAAIEMFRLPRGGFVVTGARTC